MPIHKSNNQLMNKKPVNNAIPINQLRMANTETIGFCLRNDIASFSITFNQPAYAYIVKLQYKNINRIERETFCFINRVNGFTSERYSR